jgi:hypothetical protein
LLLLPFCLSQLQLQLPPKNRIWSKLKTNLPIAKKSRIWCHNRVCIIYFPPLETKAISWDVEMRKNKFGSNI